MQPGDEDEMSGGYVVLECKGIYFILLQLCHLPRGCGLVEKAWFNPSGLVHWLWALKLLWSMFEVPQQ